jgi:hypothetical protein
MAKFFKESHWKINKQHSWNSISFKFRIKTLIISQYYKIRDSYSKKQRERLKRLWERNKFLRIGDLYQSDTKVGVRG